MTQKAQSNFKKTKTKLEEKKEQALSAGQRLEILEKTTTALRKMVEVMAQEMDKFQQTQIALAKRLDAALKVSSEEGLSDKVTEYMLNEEVQNLKSQVEELIKQGVLVAAEEIRERSFVVGQEIAADGEVVSARTQASVPSLPEELRNQLMGKKVGDLVKFENGELSLQISEVYDIVSAETKQAAEA